MKMAMEDGRLIEVTLDPASIAPTTPAAEHERRIAIADLVEDNRFLLPNHPLPAYRLDLGILDQRLTFKVSDIDGAPLLTQRVPLSPFRRLLKDYWLLCDSYYAALRTATPEQIETIDFGRRGLHDEASQLLMSRLADAIRIDLETARRFFTLLSALQAPA